MTLTDLEAKVYNGIKSAIESEDIYCVHVSGILDECDGLTLAQVKGCVGSLIKKGAIAEVEPNHFEHLSIAEIVEFSDQQKRDTEYRQKWQDIYDNDMQDLY